MLAYIIWNPDPNAIDLGFLKIQWYGISWGMALMAVYWIGTRLFRILQRDEEKLVLAIQYVFIGGLLGARVGHIVFYQLEFYLSHPEKILAVWEGGLASHGGMLGALLALWLFHYRYKEYSYLFMLDITAVCIPIFCALVRLGNLMNSELVGKMTGSDYGFVFPAYGDAPRHPVVLYESVAYFIMQAIMLFIFGKYKNSRPGIYSTLMLAGIFGVRFLIEFFKEPDGIVIGGIISKTQLLNLPFILGGLLVWYFVVNKKTTPEKI